MLAGILSFFIVILVYLMSMFAELTSSILGLSFEVNM